MLDKAGIIIKAEETEKIKKEVSNKNPKTKKINYSKLSLIQLEKAVAIAVKNEDYELAAFLRDEINRK